MQQSQSVGMSQASSRCTQQMLSQNPDAGFEWTSDNTYLRVLRQVLRFSPCPNALSHCRQEKLGGTFACVWQTRGRKGPGHLPAQVSGGQSGGQVQPQSQAVRQQAIDLSLGDSGGQHALTQLACLHTQQEGPSGCKAPTAYDIITTNMSPEQMH